MYTILVRQDNTVIHSARERIMHRSSNVNSLRILADKIYINTDSNGNVEEYDMRNFSCILEYKLPISDKYTPVILSPSEELYKDKVQYIYPIESDFTSEVGDVEIKFTFTKLEMDADGNMTERVRKLPTSTITILPVARWSDYIADSNLDSIAQVMLTLQSKIEQQNAYSDMIHAKKGDALRLDKENNKLCLDANGKPISEIDLNELGDEIAESNEDGLVKIII